MSLLGFRSDDEPDTRPSPGTARPPRRRGPRWRGLVALVVALLVVVGGGVAVYRVGTRVVAGATDRGPTDFTGTGTTPVRVRVSPGDSTRTIADTLAGAGVVASAANFLQVASADPRAATIQPGTYPLRRRMPAAAALAALTDPSTRVGQVSVPEGLTVSATLGLLSQRSGIALPQLTAAAAALPAARLTAYHARSPEGFLYPSTYDVQRTTPPAEVLASMVERFREVADGVGLAARAKSLGYTPYQVLTIASLVQAEVPDPSDQARVARVLYNRLHAGMKLQLDSTVHYVTGRNGSVFTTSAERAVTSPYNTYLVTGLPPTPIDSPGQSALRAATNPAAGPWLYYVTVNLDTGETLFATTAAGQEANRRQLQSWCTANPGRC